MNEMRDQTRPDVVRVQLTVAAPIERAFEVFAQQMDAWWPRSYGLGSAPRTDLVLEPKEGGRWYERDAEDTECDWGRVLLWDPPEHLVLTWQIAPGFVAEGDPERASRVEVRFAAHSMGSTRVTLMHDGFERHGPGWESIRDAVANEGGWPGIMRAYRELTSE